MLCIRIICLKRTEQIAFRMIKMIHFPYRVASRQRLIFTNQVLPLPILLSDANGVTKLYQSNSKTDLPKRVIFIVVISETVVASVMH